MDRRNRLGLGQAQDVAVAAQVARVVAEPVAPEVGLAEPVRLEHRPHRAIQDHDSLVQDPGEGSQTSRAIERRRRRDAAVRSGRRGGGHDATATAGCRARIRRTSSAHCSYRPKLGMT